MIEYPDLPENFAERQWKAYAQQVSGERDTLLEQLRRLHELCETYGLPGRVDALVRHIEGNVGLTKYLEATNDQTDALQHVGWLADDGSLFKPDVNVPNPLAAGMRPVFTHDDWLTKVPATVRNQVGDD